MGPRNCIGQRLALMQVRLVLAKLFWHFDVGLVEGSGAGHVEGMGKERGRAQVDWAQQKVFTLWEKEGGWVRLKARAK